MKRIITIIAATIIASISGLHAQDSQKESEEFKSHGSIILKAFTNFHNTWQGSGSQAEFEVTRAYLGYEYQFNKNFFGRVILDVGDPGVGGFRNVAYLKNAYLSYNINGFTASLGMIGSNQFNVQEKVWGNRYIMKSFQDEYKFGPSADLGLLLEYKITDWVSVDAAFMNGEGYKLVQLDSTFKFSGGATFTLVKKLKIRGYYDITTSDTNQQTFAAFVGWVAKRWSAGGEYNIQLNHFNIDGNDFSGISVYGSFDITSKIGIFGRYDYVESVKPAGVELPWNYKRDGQLVLVGFQYSPVKYVKIGPNFQLWTPRDGSIPEAYSAYLSIEFKL